MFEIAKQFTFEAAHRLPMGLQATRNARLHGHSFRVEVRLRGRPAPDLPWLHDFDDLDRRLGVLRAALDHQFLNELPGLAVPTLETLSAWLWERLRPDLPALHSVTVHRDSCGESCTYRGADAPAGQAAQATV